MTRLHYIYDPLCGWCYGAAPLIKLAREHLPVLAHAGGMMTGARRQAVTAQLRDFVLAHDRHIAEASGQPFGAAYADGLLLDPQAVFDSEPPTAAVLAAEQIAARGLDMLAALQQAHYVDGRRIAEAATLIEIAAELGLDTTAFASALQAQTQGAVQEHIQATRALMQRVGAQGFPTLLLETPAGLQRVNLSAYLGRPEAFAAWLQTQQASVMKPDDSVAPFCGLEGCEV